jgi:hypothetical protein
MSRGFPHHGNAILFFRCHPGLSLFHARIITGWADEFASDE